MEKIKKSILCKQCKKIGEVSYMIDWYRLPERKGHALVLMIAMSNSSVKFTAGNLFELSLSTFGDVSNAHCQWLLNLSVNNIKYYLSNL